MTAIQEMAQFLENEVKEAKRRNSCYMKIRGFLDKARSLAEKEAKSKPPCKVDPSFLCDNLTADGGLIEELKSLCKNNIDGVVSTDALTELYSRYTPAEKQEPLAVAMAKRIKHNKHLRFCVEIILYNQFAGTAEWVAKGATMQEAESKAREYLNGLPDKKGE